ncbi:ABC transporter permease subunit [Mesorhizobium sp. M0991]|uniref:ABC transporter permease subunit n=1 Tax=Mesorhizobium sp. M0991 TaxID=2957043 RepID=UPI00333A127B
MRSPEAAVPLGAPFGPLLAKELREMASGRPLWIMLLILCPLIDFSFFQAVSLYSNASATALDASGLASALSPIDGVLVPTFGGFYVAVTLLFPFVAIRVLGNEKESGALRLLIQLPYRTPTLIGAKLVAVFAAWLIAAVPAISALAIWEFMGGHLFVAETLNLVLGHLLYGLLVGAIALFAAALAESAATAAIVTLGFTIGSWVIDFAAASQPDLLGWSSWLSLTQTLHTFELGLLSISLVVGVLAAILGFAALATIWLPMGVALRTKVARSVVCIAATCLVLVAAAQIRWSVDSTEDRRNSFSLADEQALAQLSKQLTITVHLVPEDPRYADLQTSILSKLERIIPRIIIRPAGDQQSAVGSASDESYGEVEYSYGGRSAVSRSTGTEEILPLLYGLANVPLLAPVTGTDDYPGYPLVAVPWIALPWFLGGLPLLIGVAWWRCRRVPTIEYASSQKEISRENLT